MLIQGKLHATLAENRNTPGYHSRAGENPLPQAIHQHFPPLPYAGEG